MAKSATVRKLKENVVNMDLLAKIGNGDIRYTEKTDDIEVLLTHNPPLIEVNFNDVNPDDNEEIAVRLSPEGAALIINVQLYPIESKKIMYEVSNDTGFVIPASKRGGRGGGAPSKYPFDTLNVNGLFFVPASSTQKDPAKKLISTAASAMHRYANKTGETKIVERSKRGAKNRLILDVNGDKIMETKEVEVLEFTRKFKVVPVKSGAKYGSWVAPSDGAVVIRTQ